LSFLVDSYVFVTGGGNEAFVGGGYNGAFGGSTDEFFTFNIDTDTWSSVVTFPYTTYNQGGAGSSTDTIFWGGYNSGGGSNPTLTQNGMVHPFQQEVTLLGLEMVKALAMAQEQQTLLYHPIMHPMVQIRLGNIIYHGVQEIILHIIKDKELKEEIQIQTLL